MSGSGVFYACLVAGLLPAIFSEKSMTRHQLELKEHYEHLSKIAEFECNDPQPRLLSVNELMSEQQLLGKAYFPEVTVMHRCDRHVGSCNDGFHKCGPVLATTVSMPFKATYLQDMGEHLKGEWEMEYHPMENHTSCGCLKYDEPPKPPKTTVHYHYVDLPPQNLLPLDPSNQKAPGTESSYDVYVYQNNNTSQQPPITESYQESETSPQPDQYYSRPESSSQPDQYSSRPGSSYQPDQYSSRPGSSSQPDQYSSRPGSFSQPDQFSSRPGISSQPDQYSSRPGSFSQTNQFPSRPGSSSQPDQYSSRPGSSSQPDQFSSRPGSSYQPDQFSSRPGSSYQPDEYSSRPGSSSQPDQYSSRPSTSKTSEEELRPKPDEGNNYSCPSCTESQIFPGYPGYSSSESSTANEVRDSSTSPKVSSYSEDIKDAAATIVPEDLIRRFGAVDSPSHSYS